MVSKKSSKLEVDAIKFMIARRDSVGVLFKDTVCNNISLKFRDLLFNDPYNCVKYHVIYTIEEVCKNLFKSNDWFLYLEDKNTERILIDILNMNITNAPELINRKLAEEKLQRRINFNKQVWSVYRYKTLEEANELLENGLV